MVSALNPTRYLVSSISSRLFHPSVGASTIEAMCFFSRTAATDAKLMGGKTLGLPHALGCILGGLIRQTRIAWHFLNQTNHDGSIKTLS
jgi:hypothetical protein